jgi:hypothetical protein
MALEYKTEEFNKLKVQAPKDLEAAVRDTFNKQETRYAALLASKIEEHKQALAKKERDIMMEHMAKAGRAEKQQLFFMFDKWRLLSRLHRKSGSDVERTQSFIQGVIRSFEQRGEKLNAAELDQKRAQVEVLEEELQSLQ